MKFVFATMILASSVAFAEGETTPAAPKTEETVALSEESTEPLFDRVKVAHKRAEKTGTVVAKTNTK
jgi:hypothetical protein